LKLKIKQERFIMMLKLFTKDIEDHTLVKRKKLHKDHKESKNRKRKFKANRKSKTQRKFYKVHKIMERMRKKRIEKKRRAYLRIKAKRTIAIKNYRSAHFNANQVKAELRRSLRREHRIESREKYLYNKLNSLIVKKLEKHSPKPRGVYRSKKNYNDKKTKITSY